MIIGIENLKKSKKKKKNLNNGQHYSYSKLFLQYFQYEIQLIILNTAFIILIICLKDDEF